MKSKLTYVAKTDINQISEVFQLLKKMPFEELQERCKSLPMCHPIVSSKLIIRNNAIICTGITITHFAGFISIEGHTLKDIIETAWIIDTGYTMEENLTNEIYS